MEDWGLSPELSNRQCAVSAFYPQCQQVAFAGNPCAKSADVHTPESFCVKVEDHSDLALFSSKVLVCFMMLHHTSRESSYASWRIPDKLARDESFCSFLCDPADLRGQLSCSQEFSDLRFVCPPCYRTSRQTSSSTSQRLCRTQSCRLLKLVTAGTRVFHSF